MPEIELYGRQSCPYSTMVRDKLDEIGVDYEETDVPEAHADRDEVESRTGQTGVPVLFDSRLGEGEFIADSNEIISYLEDEYA